MLKRVEVYAVFSGSSYLESTMLPRRRSAHARRPRNQEGIMRSQTFGRVTISLIVTLGIGTTVLAVRNRLVGVQHDGNILVPTGQQLTPAGTHIEVNDRPLGMAVSPDGSLLAVVTGSNFSARALHLIDVQSRTLKQTIAITNS